MWLSRRKVQLSIEHWPQEMDIFDISKKNTLYSNRAHEYYVNFQKSFVWIFLYLSILYFAG